MTGKPIDEAALDRACEAYAEIADDCMGLVRRRAMREALIAAQQGQAVEPAPPSAPVGAAEDMVLDAIERRESSAPVGVDAPGSRSWMAEVCRAAALSLAAHGVRNDQLSKVADWIAQQPAAVDEGFVSRLAEALTDQDWDVDPDGDGSGIAQLRAAVVAAQQQGGRADG